MASSRPASSAPQRSTAALSVDGDSMRTSASIVSSSHARSARQKSRSRIIGFMLLPLIGGASPHHPLSPQPFPRPGPPPAPPPPQPAPQQPVARPPSSAPAPRGVPTDADLGLPIYPGAQFIASYDAGRGQRYYIF